MARRLVLLLVSLAPVTVWAQSTDAVDRAQTSKSRHAPAESRLLRAGVAGEPPNVIASQELNAILLRVDQRIRFEEMLRDWNLFRSKPASRQSPLSALPSGETH